jgi:hypothetical protein
MSSSSHRLTRSGELSKLSTIQEINTKMDRKRGIWGVIAPRGSNPALNDDEVVIIIELERAGAILSLVGVVMIFITYSTFRRLRTVPNLFILLASIANVGASIACIMGYDGIRAGVDTPICQAQAFLLELCAPRHNLMLVYR